ncbi:MAG: YiaA/YiaB family inner membrane protein, partial [Bacteroidota bacterium]
MQNSASQTSTAAWRFQIWASFLISLVLTAGGIFLLPVDFWIKGYLLMGMLFLVGSCFSLSKTLRDEHE